MKSKFFIIALIILFLPPIAFSLDSTSSIATGVNTQQKIVRENSKKIDLVYYSAEEIYYSSSTDNGATWSSALNLSNSDDISYLPAIAVDSNSNLHVVWQEKIFGSWQIVYKKFSNAAQSWDYAYANVSNTSGKAVAPSIAIDSNNNLHLAWYNESGNSYEVYYKKRTADGAWDSSAANISNSAADSVLPSIAIKNNYPAIVWSEGANQKYNVYYSHFNGTNWLTPLQISNSSELAYYPDIAVDKDSNAHVVWMESINSAFDIIYRKFNASTSSWESTANLSNNSSTSWFPTINSFNHKLSVVWQDDNAGSFNIQRRFFDENWETAKMISTSGKNQYAQLLNPINDKNSLIVWTQNSTAPFNIASFLDNANMKPKIKIISPNGLMRIKPPTFTIDFNARDLDNERLTASIYYSTVKGAKQNQIASGLDLNSSCSDKDFSIATDNNCFSVWSFPSLTDGNYFIDIEVNDGTTTIVYSSDNNFQIVANLPPDINIATPNGGETFSGTTNRIYFNTSDPENDEMHASIYYSTVKGAKQNQIASDLNLSLSTICTDPDNNRATSNSCYFDWNTTGITDGRYFIDINVWDANFSVMDSSDNNFLYTSNRAPIIAVVSPNGGEIVSGYTYRIDFNASDREGDSIRAKIYYSETQLGFQNLIAAIDLNASYCIDSDANTKTTNYCSWVWTVPLNVDNNFFWIDINAFDQNFADYDSSDQNFMLLFDANNPTIQINSPTSFFKQTRKPGQNIDLNFSYVEENPDKYIITIKSGNTVVCSKTRTGDLNKSDSNGSRIIAIDTCALDSNALEGFYDLNIALVDTARHEVESTQFASIRIDSTSPTVSITNAATETVFENKLFLNCYDAVSGCNPTKAYYFNSTTNCSQTKTNYIYSISAKSLLIDSDHADYLCIWFEDNVSNSAIASAKLNIDTSIFVLSKQNPEEKTTLSQPTNYCSILIDSNLTIDCQNNVFAKLRLSKTNITKTFSETPSIIVSEPKEIKVITPQHFTSQNNPDYYFVFKYNDANIVSGTEKTQANSLIRQKIIPLLQSDGNLQTGTLYTKIQIIPKT